MNNAYNQYFKFINVPFGYVYFKHIFNSFEVAANGTLGDFHKVQSYFVCSIIFIIWL